MLCSKAIIDNDHKLIKSGIRNCNIINMFPIQYLHFDNNNNILINMIKQQYTYDITLLYIIIEKFINNGGDINIKNNYGYNLLQLVLINNKCDDLYYIVKYLVKNGIDINSTNKYKETSIFYAMLLNNVEIIKYLMVNNANIDKYNKYNISPLNVLFKYNNNYDCLYYMITYKKN